MKNKVFIKSVCDECKKTLELFAKKEKLGFQIQLKSSRQGEKPMKMADKGTFSIHTHSGARHGLSSNGQW